jgi:hypothetical protein
VITDQTRDGGASIAIVEMATYFSVMVRPP